jgi:hypothetical protein
VSNKMTAKVGDHLLLKRSCEYALSPRIPKHSGRRAKSWFESPSSDVTAHPVGIDGG